MSKYQMISPERLVFAVARGARYQESFPDTSYKLGQIVPDLPDGEWLTPLKQEVFYSVQNRDEPYLRVHPNDTHLAYGPLTSALVEHVTTCPLDSTEQNFDSYSSQEEATIAAAMLMASTWLLPEEESELDNATDDQFADFWLMASEAMADEGL
jgi:hypothetical protein